MNNEIARTRARLQQLAEQNSENDDFSESEFTNESQSDSEPESEPAYDLSESEFANESQSESEPESEPAYDFAESEFANGSQSEPESETAYDFVADGWEFLSSDSDDPVVSGPWVPITYMCDEVDYCHQNVTSANGGTILSVTLLYLEDVVLIPASILTLRIIEKVYKRAVKRAAGQADSHFIGVVRAYKDPETGRMRSSTVGTTAEILEYDCFNDGSLKMDIIGKKRFYVRRQWRDVKGKSCGEVQVIEEDTPLRPPRDAFGHLPPLSNVNYQKLQSSSKPRLQIQCAGRDHASGSNFGFFVSESSSSKKSSIQPTVVDDTNSVFTSSDDSVGIPDFEAALSPKCPTKLLSDSEGSSKSTITRNGNAAQRLNKFRTVPRAFLPCWVYEKNDPFYLAKKAADLLVKVATVDNMEDLVRKPDSFSFRLANELPLSVSTRQEVLEINGVSNRLRRLIQLLERFDLMRCKQCKTVIYKRSDEVLIGDHGSRKFALGGIYHPLSVLLKADGLVPLNENSTDCNFFPGYARTLAKCSSCSTELGWLFNAINPELKPKSFWCIQCLCFEADEL